MTFEDSQSVDMLELLEQEPDFMDYVKNMHIEFYKVDKEMRESLKFIYTQYQIGTPAKNLAKTLKMMKGFEE